MIEKVDNVLSLFDGPSTGQYALNEVGIKYDNYFASEIDKHAINVTMARFPKTIQLGDVTTVKKENLPDIGLLIGGSPCQGFSFGGKQLNFDDPRSKLFFEFVRLRDELNPKYWMLENVLMKDEFVEVINKYLGVEPVMINSESVSAQNRKRLYWANFKIEQPKRIETSISDIIEEGEYKYPASIRGRVIDGEDGFNQTLMVRKDITKSNCLTTVCKDNVLSKLPPGNYRNAFDNKQNWRYYTLKECCRLQTLPDDYFDGVASEHQAKRMLGNGWTSKVIESNFRGMI